ncbi:alpha/beta hydrolase [Bradyrhizobium sp.]|jgi:3-oxoadipate enol-lactonase|uniref:alpha/beta fold hydrolase n=1 Tax=Bradyrhizobium sp. TaxID=376 RepID=UPI002D571CBE|nr:alpha/beta hydrolase [Bradyrhizobium sp.]HZR76805.1 alpha/beta hydrolase [Bradyrhizobium sp.]
MSVAVVSSSGNAIAADGASIAYTLHAVEGSIERPRIALIHSLALDRTFWDGVVPLLTPHADVLAYDCRGHGQSARVRMTYTPELFAGDLANLLDHVGWRRAIIAGCSMGGCVAQAFAGAYPERAQALAVMDSTAWYGPTAPKDWRERAATAATKGLSALIGFQATRWVSDAFREQHPDVMQKHIDVFLANDVECYRATCQMLGDADLRHYQAAMRLPVSVIVGEEDYATPVAMSEQLHEALRNATLSVLPNVRHLTPIECPELIAEKILTLARQV